MKLKTFLNRAGPHTYRTQKYPYRGFGLLYHTRWFPGRLLR